MRWLVIALTLISLVSVAQADIDFDTSAGNVSGTPFVDGVVTARFNWAGGPLDVFDLSPFGVASFGTGSLGVFGPADFVEVTFSVAPGFVITGVGFDVGDFGEDLDAVTVTTIDETLGINNTTQLMSSPTIEGPFGFTSQRFTYTIGDGLLADGTIPSLLIQAGGPDFVNSMFLDNFSFSVVAAGAFQAGTDDPTSGLGGGTTGQNLTGDGSVPTSGGNGTIPEPSALALLAAGLAALALRRRR